MRNEEEIVERKEGGKVGGKKKGSCNSSKSRLEHLETMSSLDCEYCLLQHVNTNLGPLDI